MRRTARNSFAFYAVLLASIWLTLALSVKGVMAHGGEDHGDKKVEAAPAGAGMIARVVRVGDYEVTIKYPNVEPDKETAARVFLTRFATNEPVADAKIVLLMQGVDGVPAEVSTTPSATPGLYEVKLPPMPQGDCKLTARVDINGSAMTADFGTMQIKMPEAAALTGGALWARTVLIVLAGLLLLGLLAAAVYFTLPQVRRNRFKGETATA